ncbi:MAG: four-helix bundle copper-binding protein [Nitrosomonadales bacterium]|nr:four-helix bundle copper-binding protein [Nitrosomonadales bacterium]
MDRRELLLGAASLAASAAAGSVFAAGEHEHMNHEHMGMDMQHEHGHEKSTRNQKLIDAAADCVLKAQLCLQHCLVAMGKGEKELAACAMISSQTEAMCAALQQMAAAESKRLPQLAKVVMEVCKDCEDECKKTDMHPECKACGEACTACIKECKAIAA